MRAIDRIARVLRQLDEAGPLKTLRHISNRLYQRAFPPAAPVDPFDLRYGVDTGGHVGGRHLASGHAHDSHSVPYWGTAPSLFEGSLSRWKGSLADAPYSYSDYAFIDIGCGKGRVVMLASDSPFRQVIGVELSPAMAMIAQENLMKWKRSAHLCNDITVLHADALEVPFPDSPVLVYLFNPFDAHMTQLLLERLHAVSVGRPTPIDIIYTRPEYTDLFARVPNMHLLWHGDVPFSAEDAAADIFHGHAQGCAIYRLAASPQSS